MAEPPILGILKELLIQFEPHISGKVAVLYRQDYMFPVSVKSVSWFNRVIVQIL